MTEKTIEKSNRQTYKTTLNTDMTSRYRLLKQLWYSSQ